MAHDHSHADISRRTLLRTAMAAGVTASLPRLGWAAAPQVTRDMARAAGAWLAALDQRQQREAQLEWASRLRESWHYVPRSRPGVALRSMSPAQTAAAWDLLGSLLSARGLDQVRGQLTIERILGELSGSPELPRSRQLRARGVRRSGRQRALGLALRGPPPLAQRARRSRPRRGGDAGRSSAPTPRTCPAAMPTAASG